MVIPFLLNKDTPSQGYDLDDYINQKYGNGVAAQAAIRLDQAGRSIGIIFNRSRRIVNTINSVVVHPSR
jgi:predicted DsbA family dithiol-disulfide isomerase